MLYILYMIYIIYYIYYILYILYIYKIYIYISRYKAIVVITGRAHCFHSPSSLSIYIYIYIYKVIEGKILKTS